MTHTAADMILDFLKASGVNRVYGLPGDSLNGFTDAMRRDGTVDWIHVRHEEVAAFAATAEATLTGELAVCAASCGPGNLHLINGLFDAYRNRVPVLAIASHIPSVEIGSTYFQETHPQELFRECSVYCELVNGAEQLPRVLEMAMRAAVSRRGVAVVVVPGDVFLEPRPEGVRASSIRTAVGLSRPGDDDLRAAAEILNNAHRVTIFAGAGCEGGRDEVLAIAKALGAPILHTLRGKEFMEHDNPFDVGMTGLLGFASGYYALERCDALLIAGADFPYRDFFPKDSRVVQIDVRGEQIGRRVHVDQALVGTVKDTGAALLPLLNVKEDQKHLSHCVDHYRRTRAHLDDLASQDGHLPLHPQVVVRRLSELAAPDAVFIPDVGTPIIWSARYLKLGGGRRLIGSFNHGSMANAMPQAIGAQAAFPGRQVVTISGDGGLSMLMGDLITLRQQGLPVKVVVLNNGALSFVELEMKAGGFPAYGTDLNNPDFAAAATALGISGWRVRTNEELDPALRAALEHPGPALVEVLTDRQELSMPPHVTLDEVKGFTLFAGRTLFSGRGDELIDLARTNLGRLLI
jgi:pyruvate dehydrogenase (quinone)